MLISRNPKGEIEAYTDIGQFIGILPPDYPGIDTGLLDRKSAQDEEAWRTNEEGNHFKLETTTGEIKAGFGGRFNGKRIGESWGVKKSGEPMRPKHPKLALPAGPSGKKDWLSKLSGQRQIEAVKEISNIKYQMNRMKSQIDHLNNLVQKRMFSPEEVQTILKNEGKDKFREDMTPEVFVMTCGQTEDRKKLTDFMAEANHWPESAKELMEKNLSEEERKVAEYFAETYGSASNNQGVPDDSRVHEGLWQPEHAKIWLDLKSKAMEGPTSGDEIPDSLLYKSGAKKRPDSEPDYSWFQPTKAGSMEAYFARVIGDEVSYGHQYSEKEFADMNQRFVDVMKYGKLTPNDVCYHGMYAIRTMRGRMGVTSSGALGALAKPSPEMLAKLTSEEKQKVLDFVNRFNYDEKTGLSMGKRPPFAKLEDVTYDDFSRIERWAAQVNGNTIRSAEKQKPFKDYILAQEKMLIGATPSNKEAFEKAQAELSEKELQEAIAKVNASPERKEELRQGNTTAIEDAQMRGIRSVPVAKLPRQLNHDQIVSRVGGPDKTKGSCLSAAMAYAANKLGFDVLDFRGGDSRGIFAKLTTMQDFANTPEVDGRIELQKNEFKSVEKLFSEMESGKEYILSCGSHCSIVRKNERGTLEYLELQNSPGKNGYHPFEGKNGKETLKKRFGCKMKYGKRYGNNYMRPCVLIEVDKMRGCKGFENALEYINTNEKDQQKGAGGSVK